MGVKAMTRHRGVEIASFFPADAAEWRAEEAAVEAEMRRLATGGEPASARAERELWDVLRRGLGLRPRAPGGRQPPPPDRALWLRRLAAGEEGSEVEAARAWARLHARLDEVLADGLATHLDDEGRRERHAWRDSERGRTKLLCYLGVHPDWASHLARELPREGAVWGRVAAGERRRGGRAAPERPAEAAPAVSNPVPAPVPAPAPARDGTDPRGDGPRSDGPAAEGVRGATQAPRPPPRPPREPDDPAPEPTPGPRM